jgi:hypothetical protein
MIKFEAQKDGIGNIIITEESFDFLLACLDNQKYSPNKKGQDVIDIYNSKCRKILHQQYVFETKDEGYFLTKRYRYQDKLTPWSGNDVGKVYELFKDTRIKYEKKYIPENSLLNIKYDSETPAVTPPVGGWIEVEPGPWLIERSMRHDGEYLTISENGSTNRPWKEEEIKNIQKIFQGCKIEPNDYYKEELWQEQLRKMDISIIEKYLRKIKIERL